MSFAVNNIIGFGAAAAAGPPVLEAITTNSADFSITLTANKPSGVVIGDLLVIFCANDDATDTDQFIDDVTGWTFVDEAGTTSTDTHTAIYWRIADGTEAATQDITAEKARPWVTAYLRISNADTTTPFVSTALVLEGAATSYAQVWATTTVSNVLMIGAFSGSRSDAVLGVGVSVNQGFSVDEEWASDTDTSGVGAAIWHKTKDTAGSQADMTLTPAASTSAILTALEIQPPQ